MNGVGTTTLPLPPCALRLAATRLMRPARPSLRGSLLLFPHPLNLEESPFCRHPREPDVVQVRHIVELAPSCHHDIRLSHYLLPGGTMRNSILIRELAMSTNSPSLAIAGSTTAQDESVMKMPQA